MSNQNAHLVHAKAGLDDKQAGHLKRIAGLARQLPDDWSGMLGRSTLQEDFGALRFQLAYMAYALALTYVHRMPAAPAMFKADFAKLIEKMMSQDVWTYWHYVSTGNGPYNKSLGELPAEWNPVAHDNIMYSAYVQSTALLFHHLFDDDRFAQTGALTFSLKPLFWGDGGQNFVYDERSLNEHLYWTMVEKGYLGIACEPNCVFQICNQPAIFGFRLHDLIYGGDVAGEVVQGYRRAWQEFGILRPDGHYSIVVQEKEHALVQRPPLPWGDFWLGSLMHAWDPVGVKAAYPAQMAHWSRPGPGDTLWIDPAIPPFGNIRDISHAQNHGWAAVCASEVGDHDTLQRLLGYADNFLNAHWDQDGAYFYRRRDGWVDEDGRLSAMDPHTGNALLAYARLNVPDGLHSLYRGDWSKERKSQPAVVEISDGLDLRKAFFEPECARLELFVHPQHKAGRARWTVARAPQLDNWSLRIDGVEAASAVAGKVRQHGAATVRCEAPDRLVVEMDIDRPIRVQLQWSTS